MTRDGESVELVSVAVLAGGESRRMGRDKALIEVAGRTLLERTAGAARAVTDDLFVVASGREEYARFGLPIVSDIFAGAGSLGGVYSSLYHAVHDRCFVVACDMPFLNQDLLRLMAEIPRDYDVLVPVLPGDRSTQGGGQTLETLHAIYARSCMPVFERNIRAGRLKIADALTELRVRKLAEPEIRAVDPDLRSFFNINTPHDLVIVADVLDGLR